MERFFRYKIDHLIFWSLTIFFHGYTRLNVLHEAGPVHFMLELLIRNGLLAMAIYFTLIVIVPRFTRKKNLMVNLGLMVLTLAGYVAGKNAHDVYLYGVVLNNPGQLQFFYNTLYNLSIVIFYLTFAVTLYLSKQWYLQQTLLRKIELEKLNTELEYLKAQINPHFLFNSINTIYFLIDKQNKEARETLAAFSDMLRYQLYECNGADIPIEKEISYLKNYIDLQRLRKGDNHQIAFRYSPDVKNFTIAPLLLIPFVENAFKHVSHFTDKPNTIDIDLDKKDNSFYLNITNTIDDKKAPTEDSGIGLRNVKRRLELLYPGRYTLLINKTPEQFEVKLELNLQETITPAA
ncbi:MAG: histidine kinase [Cyclobacteriaceae bacterium]|nr:histidine kinase [Cyclobacteriaceae bacterium]UYN87018.1 MAG: histidine kinase [Cyclobacteriaceae bacterium]